MPKKNNIEANPHHPVSSISSSILTNHPHRIFVQQQRDQKEMLVGPNQKTIKNSTRKFEKISLLIQNWILYNVNVLAIHDSPK